MVGAACEGAEPEEAEDMTCGATMTLQVRRTYGVGTDPLRLSCKLPENHEGEHQDGQNRWSRGPADRRLRPRGETRSGE